MLSSLRRDLSALLDSAALFMVLVILAAANEVESEAVRVERPQPAGTGHPVPDDISREERPNPPPPGSG